MRTRTNARLSIAVALNGNESVDAGTIKRNLSFKNFSRNSKIPEFLSAFLAERTEGELKYFLQWVTGEPSIPVGGLQNPDPRSPNRPDCITVAREPQRKLPHSHACFYELDIFDYSNQAEFNADMLKALEYNRAQSGQFFE